jgi:methanogenic corrinoid protein MtbC1
MTMAELFKQYLEHLLAGSRCQARELIFAAHDRGITASKLLRMVLWPAMEQMDKLYRTDHVSRITEQMAMRVNRMIADQLAALLARKPKSGQRMVLVCGEGEVEELGAQIMADLFEAEGWSVWFLGSKIPHDEILEFVGKITPDILCLYGAGPADVPSIRQLVALVREVGVCPEMQILASGGVFNRAEGLAEEVRADLFAASATEAIAIVRAHPLRVPLADVPEPGRRRKRKRAGRSAKLRPAAAFRT